MQIFIKTLILTSVGEAGSRMIHVNIDAFRQIGIIAFPSKTKVPLILCVFSGSDVGNKWRLLFSLLHLTTKHLNHLIGDILVFPCTGVDTMADSSQLTQGGSKVRLPCQSTIVGSVCAELRHSDRNLRTAWFEKGGFKIEIFKSHWVDVYTHFQHTFMFKQLVKWILHPMTPLRLRSILSVLCKCQLRFLLGLFLSACTFICVRIKCFTMTRKNI